MFQALRTAILGLALAVPAAGQEGVPHFPEDYKYGRRFDESRLRLCVDTRDTSWQVAREIGEAISAALLLEPVVHEVRTGRVVESLDELYRVMLQNCAVHMGFRLVPGAYPEWLTLTRPYYTARYAFVTSHPDWQSLSDVPWSEPIASTLGSRADYRLTSYILSLPAGERWQRFPFGTNQQTLDALTDGTAQVALLWEPVLWAARQADPDAYAGIRAIAANPLPESEEGVGAVVLARETFLRTSIDQAIAALAADGTIAAILERHDFPGRVTP